MSDNYSYGYKTRVNMYYNEHDDTWSVQFSRKGVNYGHEYKFSSTEIQVLKGVLNSIEDSDILV